MLKRTLLGAAMGVIPLYAAPALADPAATSVAEVVVTGAGQTRQVQMIAPTQVKEAAPGTSPIKVLQALPGVNYQSSDPFGAYEWATRISVRGFNQNQMGFTLDGVPLGDMSYGNDNGLHISRAISSENLGVTQLSEGTGALGTASTSNLGGTIEFKSRAPSSTFGVLAAGTLGSYDSEHEFIRLDTGDLASGGAGYVSYSHQTSDKWKGYGKQIVTQLNSKFVQPLGNKVTITGFLNYSDRAENDYQDLDLALIKQFGYSLDNISHNFPLAVALANAYRNGTAYPAPFTHTPDAVDAVYYNGSGLRKDTLGGGAVDWDISDALTAHLTGYSHKNQGEGTWDTPYTASPGGTPISIRTTEYDIDRQGAIGSLDYRLGSNDIEAGFWFEHNAFNEARRFYGLNADASNRNNLDFQTDPFYTQWYGEFNTDTWVLHIQDTWKATDDLKINFGFKTQAVDIKSVQTVGSLAAGKMDNSNYFLPQIGANYNLHGYGEVFADYAKNQRAFIGSDTTGPFSTTQAGFDAIKDKLKPEVSQTGELGYRFHFGGFQATATGYYIKFDNRLLTVPSGSAIVGNPSVLANVGSVTSKGVELSARWKFYGDFYLSGAYAYDRSTYDNNTVVQTGAGPVSLPTANKMVVDAPNNIGNATLGYDDGSIFADLDLNYMSKRFFTYENDQSVPGRAIVDLNAGYRFHSTGILHGVDIQANVTNLFNLKYVATIGTNGFTFSGDYQTLQAGAPTEVFVTLRKQF